MNTDEIGDIAQRLWANARTYATWSDSRMQSDRHVKRLRDELEAAIVAEAVKRSDDKSLRDASESIGRMKAKVTALNAEIKQLKSKRPPE